MVTYDNDFEQMEFNCDEDYCESANMYAGTWAECMEQAKQNGWKIQKKHGDWRHTCYMHNYVPE